MKTDIEIMEHLIKKWKNDVGIGYYYFYLKPTKTDFPGLCHFVKISRLTVREQIITNEIFIKHKPEDKRENQLWFVTVRENPKKAYTDRLEFLEMILKNLKKKEK